AKQRSDGGDSVLRLRADEHLDRIADADRPGDGAHGAQRTAAAEERLPERLAIGNAEELTDVGARLARTADAQSHTADPPRRVPSTREAWSASVELAFNLSRPTGAEKNESHRDRGDAQEEHDVVVAAVSARRWKARRAHRCGLSTEDRARVRCSCSCGGRG